MYRLRILVVPLLAGNILHAAMNAGWLSGQAAIGGFFLLWALDILTLPLQGKMAYRYGLPMLAAASYAARLFVTFRRLSRARMAAEIAWILQDLDRDGEAAVWLARHGEGAMEREPLYAASLARYLLRMQAKISLAMDLADTALQGGHRARSHYVRGLCYLAVQENQSAIAAFETARKLAASHGDFVLAGFCYLGMGEAWNRIGEREYAQDHMLRAEITLSFLPGTVRRARGLEARPETDAGETQSKHAKTARKEQNS